MNTLPYDILILILQDINQLLLYFCYVNKITYSNKEKIIKDIKIETLGCYYNIIHIN